MWERYVVYFFSFNSKFDLWSACVTAICMVCSYNADIFLKNSYNSCPAAYSKVSGNICEFKIWYVFDICHCWGGCNIVLFWMKIPDSKVHGANMGPIWGRQDQGGSHGGPMNFAIWDVK